MVNELSGRNERIRAEMDKPNVHRLLEFAFHSLPLVGHAVLFQELIIESGHQPLKRGVNRSNKHEAHEFSLTNVLVDDWKMRMGDVCHQMGNIHNITDNECYKIPEVAFRRGDLVHSGKVSCNEVRRSFPPHLIHQFLSFAKSPTLTRRRCYIWRGRHEIDERNESIAAFVSHFITDRREGHNSVHSYEDGILVRHFESDDNHSAQKVVGRREVREQISRGSVLQLLLSDIPRPNSLESEHDVKLLPLSTSAGERSFWAVLGLYSGETGRPLFAHVSEMRAIDDVLSFENRFQEDENCKVPYVVRMTESVRTAMALHDCPSNESRPCHEGNLSGAQLHCVEDARAVWTLLGSGEGFPPQSR